jgi:hypothetical protein
MRAGYVSFRLVRGFRHDTAAARAGRPARLATASRAESPAVLDGIATLALGQLVAFGVLHGTSLPDKGVAVTIALGMVFVGLSLTPDTRTAIATPVTRSAVTGAAAAVLIGANTGWRVRPDVVGAVAAGVAILMLATHGGASLLGSLLGDPSRGRLAVAFALATACAAPVWLGPLLEAFGGPERAVDLVVAASPLTYLAVLCGYDYLRQDWFYAHSTVASLRFAYPTALTPTVFYLALAVALSVIDQRVAERRRHA